MDLHGALAMENYCQKEMIKWKIRLRLHDRYDGKTRLPWHPINTPEPTSLELYGIAAQTMVGL